MTKYRKKPVVIEAVQWDGCAALAFIMRFIGRSGSIQVPFPCPPNSKLVIETLEGNMTASPGDWIIKGIQGEFSICKPDIFEATYEPVEKS